jgi:hypothetical protein
MKIYRTHGGLVEGPPHMMEVNLVKGGEMISDVSFELQYNEI